MRAKVEIINGYSAHADRTELTAWLARVRERSPNLRAVHLVHGGDVVLRLDETQTRANLQVIVRQIEEMNKPAEAAAK